MKTLYPLTATLNAIETRPVFIKKQMAEFHLAREELSEVQEKAKDALNLLGEVCSLLTPMKRFLFIPALLIFLACSPSLKEGEIRSKEFCPAHTVMILMPLTISTGKTTTTTMMPMWFYYPDSYAIGIKKFDGKRWQSATWWVDRITYEQAQVGGYYKVRDGDLDEQPRQETK